MCFIKYKLLNMSIIEAVKQQKNGEKKAVWQSLPLEDPWEEVRWRFEPVGVIELTR